MKPDAERIAAVALAEDGDTDLTTMLTVPAGVGGEGRIEFRSGGVVAGAAYADAVAQACECRIEWRAPEGRRVTPDAVIGIVHGPLGRILRAERPMLNLLQRACGIATATRAYVDAVAGTPCRILHTRKTAPGLRALDVAAVLAGGGARHRFDLAHEVMVKDNHWQALRMEGNGLSAALAEGRRRGVASLQVEVESEGQLDEACAAGANRETFSTCSTASAAWPRFMRVRTISRRPRSCSRAHSTSTSSEACMCRSTRRRETR